MTNTATLEEKVNEIKAEMKRLSLYKRYTPGWVNDFTKRKIVTEEDFAGWLQFVYLPNRLQAQCHTPPADMLIVPQALQFFNADINKGKLLQLLIELDSL